jgi:hypothetical protein
MRGIPLASFPLLDDSDYARQIFAYNRNVLKALAPVPNGGFHLEVFRQANGKLVFLEIAARTPGAYVPQAFLKAFGINLEEAHLALQMGVDKGEACRATKLGHGAFVWYPLRAGVVGID